MGQGLHPPSLSLLPNVFLYSSSDRDGAANMPCKPRDGTRTRHGPRSISAPRRRRPYVGQSPDDDSDRTQRTKGVDAHVAAWSTAPHRTRPSPSGQSEQRGGAKELAGKAISSRETKPTNPRIPKAAAGARGWICSPAFLNLLCRGSAPTGARVQTLP